MRRENKIELKEAIMLVTMALITELFLTFPAVLGHKGQTAAWLVLLVATLVAAVAFLPTAILLERYPEKTIIEIGEELLGPIGNAFFALIIFLTFLAITSLILRQYAERTITVSLNNLPLSVAMVMLLVGAAVACYLGLEAINRSVWIAGFIIVFMLLLVQFLPFPYWQTDYLFPLGGSGLKEILFEGLKRSSLFAEVLMLAVIYPSLPKGAVRSVGLTGLLLSGLIMALTIFTTQLVFPVQVFQEMSLPTFETSRLIYFGRFIQRLESIFIPLWVFACLIKVSLGCYLMCLILTRWLKLPYYRPFILPVVVITMATAFIPANVSEAVWVDTQIVRVFGAIPAFGLPVLLLLLAFWRQRQRGKVR